MRDIHREVSVHRGQIGSIIDELSWRLLIDTMAVFQVHVDVSCRDLMILAIQEEIL